MFSETETVNENGHLLQEGYNNFPSDDETITTMLTKIIIIGPLMKSVMIYILITQVCSKQMTPTVILQTDMAGKKIGKTAGVAAQNNAPQPLFEKRKCQSIL